METQTETKHHASDTVTVRVNTRPVTLPTKKATGLSIKEAAVHQGGPVQITFSLFRITGAKQHLVKDEDEITVHDGEEFRCVRGDDNS